MASSIKPVQLALPLGKKARKRRRIGRVLVPLGRRPKPERIGFMSHSTREAHDKNHPVHVTMRRVAAGPSFRAQRVYNAILVVIREAKRKGVRILHYSVQSNHLHLMVEGRCAADLSSQMRKLFSRVALAVNAVAQRRGRLFRDRHHRHPLKTPREVRNALVYILFNDRKHRAAHDAPGPCAPPAPAPASASAPASAHTLDTCSSASWFQDWSPTDRPPSELLAPISNAPTLPAETWLARWGWHRGDPSRLVGFREMPRSL